MQITALVLLVLCGVINYLDRSALAVAYVLIRQELGLNATSMGVLLSAFLLAYALSQIPVGFLIDRLGPRTLLGCAITLWSIAQAACGFIGSFTQFYFARIGLGIGEFCAIPNRHPRGQQLVPREQARPAHRHLQLRILPGHRTRTTTSDGHHARLWLAHDVHHHGPAWLHRGVHLGVVLSRPDRGLHAG